MSVLYYPDCEYRTAITSTSDIRPKNRNIAYRGHDIQVLSQRSTYEEVCYLLLFGALPDAGELQDFSNNLAESRELPAESGEIFKQRSPKAHLMDVLQTAMAFLGIVDPEAKDNSKKALLRKAVRTIAKLPTVIAASHRISQRQEPISPMRQFGHARNFLYMLSGYGPDEDAVTALDAVFILYSKTESGVSSLAAWVAASSFTDYHSAITAEIGSLKRKQHGAANEEALRRLLEIKETGRAEEWIRLALAGKERIMGFGQGVHKQGDARARIMKKLSKRLADQMGDNGRHTLCEKIEEIMLREKGLRYNLDLYAGQILHMLGVPTGLCAPIFAAGRVAGWSAHIIAQIEKNRFISPPLRLSRP